MFSISALSAKFSWLRRMKRKWDFRHVSRWRLDLSEYELVTLIPFFRGRIDDAVDELQKVVDACVSLRNEGSFGAAYLKLIDPDGLMRKADGAPRTNIDGAQEYFDKVKTLTQRTLDNAKNVQNDWKNIVDISTFSKAISGLSYVCSILERNKETAFRVTPLAIISVTEIKTGRVLTLPKLELEILNFPFQNSAENLALLGQSTRESIEHWIKEQLEWKTRHLNIVEHRWAVGANIFTVVSAVALSWLFLTLNDPYKMSITESTNKDLNEQLIKTNETLEVKVSEISDLTIRLIEKDHALKTCEATQASGAIEK
jgi:hypothetical protein